jgi:DNA-binding MarR family transcriptional regulator
VSGAEIHVPLSDSDRKVLAFLAAHRLVLARQVQALLNVSDQAVHERLDALEARRFLRHSRVTLGRPGYYQITHIGLAVIASDLPPPRLELDRCWHDIGAAWLWLAGARQAFGRAERVLSEREQQSHDAARKPGEQVEPPLGVPVTGLGTGAGNPIGLHYPDVLLIGEHGERVAIELALNTHLQRELQIIMAGYAADPNIAAVLYLGEIKAVRHVISSTAARLGISDLIHVQPVAWPREPLPATAR